MSQDIDLRSLGKGHAASCLFICAPPLESAPDSELAALLLSGVLEVTPAEGALVPGCLGVDMADPESHETRMAVKFGPRPQCSSLLSLGSLERGGRCVCAAGHVARANSSAAAGSPPRRAGRSSRRRPLHFTCARLCALSLRSAACSRFLALAAPPQPPVPMPVPVSGMAAAGALQGFWRGVEAVFRAAGGPDCVHPPGPRAFDGSPKVDWVARGVRMPAASAAQAQRQWRAFAASMPAFPTLLFSGRGVVILGGGAYMQAAWVAVGMLRRSGCTLPAEMWFLEAELPGPLLGAALAARGVRVRSVDEITPHASERLFRSGAPGFGYRLKAAVIVFSAFREVLYLDSDNVVLSDPTDLFTFPPYVATGALFWPDYWSESVAPDFYAVTGGAGRLVGTTESGQILMDKRTAWAPLLLALFLNLQGDLYYNLLTNYMGAGDKETFRAAMLMLNRTHASVSTPVGSAGFVLQPGSAAAGAGREEALCSTAMVQHHPATGQPLMIHNNLNKWRQRSVSAVFPPAQRVWAVLTPPGYSFLAHAGQSLPPLLPWERALAHLGCAPGIGPGSLKTGFIPERTPPHLELRYDPEQAAWQLVMELRCGECAADVAEASSPEAGEAGSTAVGSPRASLVDWASAEPEVRPRQLATRLGKGGAPTPSVFRRYTRSFWTTTSAADMYHRTSGPNI